MKPAFNRGFRKALRTLLQMGAGGGLTALVDLAAHGLSPAQAGAIMVAWTTAVTFLHNYLETAGVIPALFPTPGLVTAGAASGMATKVLGTIDTTTATIGGVVTDVVNTNGKVVGGVVGTVDTPPLK